MAAVASRAAATREKSSRKPTAAEAKAAADAAAAKAEKEAEEEEARKKQGKIRKALQAVMDFLDQTWLQTLQYILFLYTFQSLVGTLRKSEEFYLDKYITDTFIDNTFDVNHNKLSDIRRVADIWEWSNTVLLAGLFSNADAGEWWPDGDGSFHLDGATPLSTAEVVDQMNQFDFTQGVVFKQVVAPPSAILLRRHPPPPASLRHPLHNHHHPKCPLNLPASPVPRSAPTRSPPRRASMATTAMTTFKPPWSWRATAT